MTNPTLTERLRVPQEGGDTYLPLEAAVLCAECGCIFHFARATCPSCCNAGRLSLPAILNRQPVEVAS